MQLEGCVQMGYKNKGSKVNYLVFADDIVVVTESLEEAAEPDNPAPKTSKAGLWNSYNKSQYMTNLKDTVMSKRIPCF